MNYSKLAKQLNAPIVVALFSFLFAGAVFVESASAGEAIPRSPRIRIGGTNSFRVRTARFSTAATKALNRIRPDKRSTSLRTSNPYDYRIVQHQNAESDYQVKLAKWEARVAKMAATSLKKE